MNKTKRMVLLNVYFLISGIAVLMLDQVTKYLVITNVAPGNIKGAYQNFLYIVNIKNTGAAFGMFQGYTGILTIISFVAIILIIILKIILNLDYGFL